MASVVPAYEEPGMSIGRVFQRAFSTIAHNPVVVIGIAAIIGAVPSVIMNLVLHSFDGANAQDLAKNMSAVWGAMALSWILAAVIGAVVQGALTRATVAEYEGHRASFGDCIAAAARVLLPLIGAGLVFAIAVMVGTVLLVVPGIIVMIMWSVAAPAIVVERDGVLKAFGRSAELTQGFKWKIFGLFLVLLVIYIVLFVVLGIVGLRTISVAAAQGFTVAGMVANILTALIVNLLWGTIQPALYLELRQAKEGGSLQNLEEVFA